MDSWSKATPGGNSNTSSSIVYQNTSLSLLSPPPVSSSSGGSTSCASQPMLMLPAETENKSPKPLLRSWTEGEDSSGAGWHTAYTPVSPVRRADGGLNSTSLPGPLTSPRRTALTVTDASPNSPRDVPPQPNRPAPAPPVAGQWITGGNSVKPISVVPDHVAGEKRRAFTPSTYDENGFLAIAEADEKHKSRINLDNEAESTGIWDNNSLDVSDLGLRELSVDMSVMSSVRRLKARCNELQSLPQTLPKLTSLVELDLYSNKLKVLPEEILALPRLRVLDVGSNRLTNLPVDLDRLSKLVELGCAGNNLISLPQSVSNMTSLQRINMSANRFNEFPVCLCQLSSLIELRFRCNTLSSIPEEIQNLSSLEVLDLRCNEITSLPVTLFSLPGLRSLSLRYNRLLYLPSSVSGLDSLEELDLYDNQISNLPTQLCELKNLKRLWIKSNPIPRSLLEVERSDGRKGVMQWLQEQKNDEMMRNGQTGNRGKNKLVDLTGEIDSWNETIDFSGAELKEIPQSLSNITDADARKRVSGLNLSFNMLIDIPAIVFTNLPYLSRLYLNNNLVETLPSTLGELVHLRTLDLHCNSIEVLPRSLGCISSITSLNLSANQLKGLPTTMGQLTNLRILDLSSNKLVMLPPGMRSLLELEYLRLRFNALPEIPDELGNLSALQVLDLGHNLLRRLPDSLFALPSLRQLDVKRNLIEVLSPSLKRLTNLTSLDLSFNRVQGFFPKEIGYLQNLRHLSIDHQGISALPKEFYKLNRLVYLNISYNQILQLSPDITKFSCLEYLNVEMNALVLLPWQLGSMASLQVLKCNGNPLHPLLQEQLKKVKKVSSLLSIIHNSRTYQNELSVPQAEDQSGKLSELSQLLNFIVNSSVNKQVLLQYEEISKAKDPHTWNEKDVEIWLDVKGLMYYKPNFQRYHINGRMLLELTQEEIWRDLCIISKLHAQYLRIQIEELRNKSSVSTSQNSSRQGKKELEELSTDSESSDNDEPEYSPLHKSEDVLNVDEGARIIALDYQHSAIANGMEEDTSMGKLLTWGASPPLGRLKAVRGKAKSKKKGLF